MQVENLAKFDPWQWYSLSELDYDNLVEELKNMKNREMAL